MTGEDRLEPVFGPDGQPDAATLAGLQLDAFDPEVAASIRARLSRSPQDRQTLAALDAVRRTLHDQPSPTMPAAVTDRLTAALRAEAAARAVGRRPGPGPSRPEPDPAVRTLAPIRTRGGHRNRWLGLAAAGIAALAAGAITYGVTAGDTTAGHPSARPEAFGPPASGPSGGSGSGPRPGAAGRLPQYSDATLSGSLADIVRASRGSVSAPGNRGNGPDVAACTRMLGQPGRPIAVQHALFDGQDAYVLVFPISGERRARAYVVTAACTGGPIYVTSGTY